MQRPVVGGPQSLWTLWETIVIQGLRREGAIEPGHSTMEDTV